MLDQSKPTSPLNSPILKGYQPTGTKVGKKKPRAQGERNRTRRKKQKNDDGLTSRGGWSSKEGRERERCKKVSKRERCRASSGGCNRTSFGGFLYSPRGKGISEGKKGGGKLERSERERRSIISWSFFPKVEGRRGRGKGREGFGPMNKSCIAWAGLHHRERVQCRSGTQKRAGHRGGKREEVFGLA